jgi:predicted SprT family Zn-dependent metalloprotease
MALKEPENMDELVYFTRRTTADGKVRAWVFKELCPKCKKGLMGKPIDPKTGRFKIREKEYICQECKYTLPAQEYEDTLTTNIEYTCGACQKSGQTTAPFKRKTYMGVKSILFECENCHKKIPITKKMKEPKAKKGPAVIPDLDDD